MEPISSFSGLSSGIQWRDMIEQIMRLETARRIDPIQRQLSAQQPRADAWRNFQGLVSKLSGAARGFKEGTAFDVLKASASATSTGRQIVSATANASAKPGDYKVEVLEVARADKMRGTEQASATDPLGLQGEFVLNGRAINVVTTDSLNAIRDKINAANSGSSKTGVTATIISTGATAHGLVLTADATGSRGIELVDSTSNVLQSLGVLNGSQIANKVSGGTATETMRFDSTGSTIASMLGVSTTPPQTTIVVEGKKIDVDLTTDTLISVRNKIWAATGLESSARLVQETVSGRTMHRLAVSGSVAADSSLATDAERANSQRAVELLGFTREGRSNSLAVGSDAKFSIDGFEFTRRTNTITDALPGVTIDLLATDGALRTATVTGDLSLQKDPKTLAPGTYGVRIQTSTARATTGLAILKDPGITGGPFDVELTTTSSTKRTTSASPSTVLSVLNAPTSTLAGLYTLHGITSTARETTATANLSVTNSALGSAAAGTYDVQATVARSGTTSSASLSITNNPSTVAAGSYDIEAITTTTRSTSSSTSELSVWNAPSNVAAGTYEVVTATSRSTGVSTSNLSVNAAPSTTVAGTYAVNVTAQASVASVTGSGFSGTYTKVGVPPDDRDPFTVGDGTNNVTVDLVNGDSLSTIVTKLNNAFGSTVKVRAEASGGQLRLVSTAAAGSSSKVVITANSNTTSQLGAAMNGTKSGTDIQGTIGGLSATGSGNVLTGSSGAVQGLQVSVLNNATGSVGNVTVTDSVTGGTVGGQAATWNATDQTLTTAAGLSVKYTGPAVSGSRGTVTVTDTTTITGGKIGGQNATWDQATQTFTGASGTSVQGLAVKYTGPVQAGVVGSATLTDTITGGKFVRGGTNEEFAASWDAGTQTFTATSGLAVKYTGTHKAGSVGSFTLTDTTTLTDGKFVKDGVEHTATWDANAKVFRGDAGTDAAGLEVYYTGGTVSGVIGDVTVTDETTTVINGGTVGGHAAVWDQEQKTLTAAGGTPLAGLKVRWDGAVQNGVVGQVHTDAAPWIIGATIQGEEAVWDAANDVIRGAAGTIFEGLELGYAGPITSGKVGDLTITGDGGVTVSVTRDLDAAVKAVQSFATAYNEIGSFLQKQRAPGAPLASDSALRGMASSITDSLFAPITGLRAGTTYSRPSSAGVEITRSGTLEVNADTLKKAMEANMEDVRALFSGYGGNVFDTTDKLAKPGTGNIAQHMDTFSRSSENLTRRMDAAQTRLEIRRAAMVKQFTEMERVMSRAQQQSAWLGQQIRAMQPSGR